MAFAATRSLFPFAAARHWGSRSLLLLAIFGLAFAAPPLAQAADKAPPPAFDKSDKMKGDHFISGQHVEGHIAYLHAELRITPEQEILWAPVADAMRQDVMAMQQAEDNIRDESHSHETAVQYLHNRTIFAELRADSEARFLNALAPLYDNLSDDQKCAADELLIPHMPEAQ